MAKILVAFCNGVLAYKCKRKYAMPIYFDSFIRGLEKYGNDVLVYQHVIFNRKFPLVPDIVEKQIKQFEPDLCILFNNAFFDLRNIVECPILIYGADTPIYFSNKYLLEEYGNSFYYALPESNTCEFIMRRYNVEEKKIIKVSSFTEVESVNNRKDIDISFIGTKFVNKEVGNSLMSLYSDNRYNVKKSILNLLNDVKKNPLILDEDIERKYPELALKDNGISVDGLVAMISGENRMKVLSCVSDIGLKIFGRYDWLTDYYYDTGLMLCFNKKEVISLNENEQIYNASKIGISIAHAQATYGFPWRVMDIMASSALLVSDYHKGIEDFFTGVKIPMYKDCYEAREICKYYLEHEDERNDIVKECNDVINSKYRLKNLLEIFTQSMGIQLISGNQKGNVRVLFIDIDRDTFEIVECKKEYL